MNNYVSFKIGSSSTLFYEVGDQGRYYAEYKLHNIQKDNKIILKLEDQKNIPPILEGVEIFATIYKENNAIWIESEYLKRKYDFSGKQELEK